MSFEVNSVHFPIYLAQSKYNTNKSFDFGEYTVLKTKLISAKLLLSTFITSFSSEGVYTFADYSSPSIPRTIVLVTNDKSSRCDGITQWPMTSDNMNLL